MRSGGSPFFGMVAKQSRVCPRVGFRREWRLDCARLLSENHTSDLAPPAFPSPPSWIGLIVFVLCLHLFGLGNHGLLEPDEGRYANMALEWIEFGEHPWSEPVLSDVGHFDKPPLIYWITGASFLAFGQNEFAARLPSLFGGLLTLAGIAMMAFRFRGPRAAWWSVLVAATSFQFWALTHLLSPDMLLCGLVTMGAALSLRAEKGRPLAWAWWLGGALFWTLGWWTKATAALVPLAALSLALLITGRRDLFAALRPGRLLLVVLILGSPWYVAMLMKFPELWDFFFHRELAGRITGHEDGREGFPGFHLVVAIVFWLPWWPVLLVRAKGGSQSWLGRPWREKCHALPWEFVAAAGVVAIYSLVSSKLVTYILPGLPYLALVAGSVLAETELTFTFRRWPAKIAAACSALLVAVALVMPRIEASLGRNSSIRQAVAEARNRGARGILCDEFWPGAEFYFGELVWFVDVKDLEQVRNLPGQAPSKHFFSKDQIGSRIGNLEKPLWVVQYEGNFENPQKWTRQLLGSRPDPDSPPVRVGDFYLWRVR